MEQEVIATAETAIKVDARVCRVICMTVLRSPADMVGRVRGVVGRQ